MSVIPGIRSPRIFEKKWIAEAFGAVPAIIVLGINAWNDSAIPAKANSGWILGGASIRLVAASVIKVRQANAQDREQRHLRDHDGLRATLYVLYTCLSKNLNFGENDRGRLRITILRVVSPDEASGTTEELEQLLPYVGGDGGETGRRYSIHLGITGEAFRNKSIYAASRQRDDYEAFINQLVAKWGYTKAQARALTSDRQSWMAVPIKNDKDDSVVAIVYLDSTDKKFFTPNVQKLVINSCGGIASYISERYKS
jgi:hypothetical protein